MAKSRSRDSSRFRFYISDRSGFQFGFIPTTSRPNAYTRESGKPVQDVNSRVCPSEYDQPPPSTKPLGGEGDISGEPRASSDFSVDANIYTIPPESVPVVYLINSSQTIPWNTNPVVFIAGSGVNQVMVSNPQISPGEHGNVLGFQCVGSSITIKSGNGVSIDFNQAQVTMQSGSIITTIFNKTDNTWHITSFTKNGSI